MMRQFIGFISTTIFNHRLEGGVVLPSANGLGDSTMCAVFNAYAMPGKLGVSDSTNASHIT